MTNGIIPNQVTKRVIKNTTSSVFVQLILFIKSQFNFHVGHQKQFTEIAEHGTKIHLHSVAQGGKKW